jgi:hypothetical protein
LEVYPFGPLQAYAVPPLAVNVNVEFKQVVGLLTVINGRGFTTISKVFVFKQPNADVPLTVYVVFDPGDKLNAEPTRLPVLVVYVKAPEYNTLALFPKQIAVGDTIAVTVGKGLTVINTVFVFEHPATFAPVTV